MPTQKARRPDHEQLYSIAEAQGGYFTAAQAREAGFSYERLSDHRKTGRFERVVHGIYRLVQFPSSRFEDLYVAWLRTGPKSAISHESALALYDLSDVIPRAIHVTVPRTASRRRKGIRLHTNRLGPDDVTRREGLPVTTPARTVADVASAGLSEDRVRQAIQQALRRGLTNSERLLAQAERRGGRAAAIIQATVTEAERSS